MPHAEKCIQGVQKGRHSLCFTVEKTFGPWDLKRIVVVVLSAQLFK